MSGAPRPQGRGRTVCAGAPWRRGARLGTRPGPRRPPRRSNPTRASGRAAQSGRHEPPERQTAQWTLLSARSATTGAPAGPGAQGRPSSGRKDVPAHLAGGGCLPPLLVWLCGRRRDVWLRCRPATLGRAARRVTAVVLWPALLQDAFALALALARPALAPSSRASPPRSFCRSGRAGAPRRPPARPRRQRVSRARGRLAHRAARTLRRRMATDSRRNVLCRSGGLAPCARRASPGSGPRTGRPLIEPARPRPPSLPGASSPGPGARRTSGRRLAACPQRAGR